MFSKKIVFPLLISLLFTGCHFFTDEEFEAMQQREQERLQALQQKNSALKEQNSALEKRVHSLVVNKPEYMQSLMVAKNAQDDKAIITQATRIEKEFPNSKEALIANQLKKEALQRVDNRLAFQTRHLEKQTSPNKKSVWYYDKASKNSLATAPIVLFITKEKEDVFLTMRLQTAQMGSDLTRGFMLISDNSRYSIMPTPSKLRHKQIASGVWIWSEQRVDKEDLDMLKDLIYSNNPAIRFLKNSSYEELPLSKDLRKSMIRVINGYKVIEETLEIKERL